MIQMASMMRSAGVDPLGSSLGQSSFPAPGNPNAPQIANSPLTPAAPGTNPAASGTAPNLYGPLGDPSALMQLLGGAGGAGFGAGAGASALPSGPPPEERFQVQLQVHILIYFGCYWLKIDCPDLVAITRYGVHQCISKCTCTACDSRECARRDRVHPRRRRIVGQESPNRAGK
jgi:hypothetical protein